MKLSKPMRRSALSSNCESLNHYLEASPLGIEPIIPQPKDLHTQFTCPSSRSDSQLITGSIQVCGQVYPRPCMSTTDNIFIHSSRIKPTSEGVYPNDHPREFMISTWRATTNGMQLSLSSCALLPDQIVSWSLGLSGSGGRCTLDHAMSTADNIFTHSSGIKPTSEGVYPNDCPREFMISAQRAATNGTQLSSPSLIVDSDEQYGPTHPQPVSHRLECLGLVDARLYSVRNSICSWSFFFPCSYPSLREQCLLVSAPQYQSIYHSIISACELLVHFVYVASSNASERHCWSIATKLSTCIMHLLHIVGKWRSIGNLGWYLNKR